MFEAISVNLDKKGFELTSADILNILEAYEAWPHRQKAPGANMWTFGQEPPPH